MLTVNERNGLEEILNSLDNEELFSLLETVTKRMFTTRNRSDAVETILACTEKPSDLLQRQKITKKIIFNYLIKRQTVLGDWGKIKLVQKCLEIWQSTEAIKDGDCIDEGKENKSTELTPVATSDMGLAFSKWFFEKLHTLQDFGPEHFWPNCNLSAELCDPSEQKQISLTGASEVVTFLANLIMLDKYYFGANNSDESVKTLMEQHGLVKILVHGVLYQHSNCVGLFDFAFGLVRNPDYEYNYKIQVIKVKMQVNCGAQGALPLSNHMSICQSA